MPLDPEPRFASAPDGFRIAYDVVGDGPPLVLLPGLMMYRGRWRETGYVDRLSGSHRLILVDPLGHGDSDRPHDPDAYALPALADHTAAVLDAEGVERADVWGYSRGCLLLIALMQHHGDRVRSAVAGGIDLTALVEPASAVTAPDESGEPPSSALRRGDWAAFWASFRFRLPADVREWMERLNDPVAIAATIDAVDTVEITVDPTQFRSMLYVGDGESFAESTAEVAALLGMPCAVLPTGGHAETFQAADVVCSTVQPFIEGA